jgi:hypothetical protein
LPKPFRWSQIDSPKRVGLACALFKDTLVTPGRLN